MAMNAHQVVVGVFDEPAMASRTVDMLQRAGIGDAQISYMDPTQDNATGFMAGLKRLFTGDSTDAGNVADNLTNMGLSDDEAQYYADQYKAGHAIIAVRPDSSEQEQAALETLRTNGAYNYTTRASASQTGAYAQSADYDQGTTTRSADYDQSGAYAQPTNYGQGTTTQSTDYDQSRTYAQSADYGQGATTRSADYDQSGTYAQPTNYGQGSTYTQPTDDNQTTDYADTDERRSLKLREEQLRAEKERVQSGEVQLHKDVVTEQKSINVPVTHEEVVIERHPVSGGQVDDAAPIQEGETIRVPVSEEQVNVTKTPKVTGEVTVGKRAVQENQQVSDTVRREEARLDRSGDVPVQGDNQDWVNRDNDVNA